MAACSQYLSVQAGFTYQDDMGSLEAFQQLISICWGLFMDPQAAERLEAFELFTGQWDPIYDD